MKPLLCFIHIPKTAGTALSGAIRAAVGSDKVLWVNSVETLAIWQRQTETSLAAYDVVGGHLHSNQFSAIQRPKVMASVLREPIRRAISYYHYVTEIAGDHHPLARSLPKGDLVQALHTHPVFRSQVTNYQCFALSGQRFRDAVLSTVESDPNIKWRIGMSDRLEFFWAELCLEYGWPYSPLEKRNVAPKGYYERFASRDAVRMLAELNAEDGALIREIEGRTQTDGRLPNGSDAPDVRDRRQAAAAIGRRAVLNAEPADAGLFSDRPAMAGPGTAQPAAPNITGNSEPGDKVAHVPPPQRDIRFRVERTVSCRDCDVIPKHADAGKVLIEDGRRIQVMHNGLRVVAGGYGAAWTEEIIERLRGHHEPQEELVFHEMLKWLPANATMIELGGYWSYYSLWFLGEAPADRRAIVIEPDPNNLTIGRRNAALNGRTIEFLQASVGDRSSSGQPFGTETAGVLTLPQVTVAELLDMYGIDRLDLLHCDTQGAELPVIRSSLDLFRQGRIAYAVFSTHAQSISGDPLTHQTCLALLESVGARIIAEHDVHESYGGDGLIAVCCSSEAQTCPEVPVSYNRYSTSLFRNPLFDLDEVLAALTRVNESLAVQERERNLFEIEVAAAEREMVRLRGDSLHLIDDLAAARQEITVKSAHVDHWWASTDRALRELATLKASWSWRITRPLRAVRRTGRSVAKAIRGVLGAAPATLPAGSGPQEWQAHPLSRGEIKRFFARQRRSIRKRVRRQKGLTAR